MIDFIEKGFEENALFGVETDMVTIEHTPGKPSVIKPLFTVETARDMGVAIKGETVKFINKNGWDGELSRAREIFTEGQLLTVKIVRIGDWTSNYEFDEVEGRWNTVMFDTIKNKS